MTDNSEAKGLEQTASSENSRSASSDADSNGSDAPNSKSGGGKKWGLLIILLLLIAGGWWGWQQWQKRGPSSPQKTQLQPQMADALTQKSSSNEQGQAQSAQQSSPLSGPQDAISAIGSFGSAATSQSGAGTNSATPPLTTENAADNNAAPSGQALPQTPPLPPAINFSAALESAKSELASRQTTFENQLRELSTKQKDLVENQLYDLSTKQKDLSEKVQELHQAAQPNPQIEAAARSLDTLVMEVETLPLAFLRRPEASAEGSAKQEAEGNFGQRLFAMLRQEVSKMVRIERVSKDGEDNSRLPVTLNQQQVVALRGELRLRLLSARLALHLHDNSLLQNEMERAQELLQTHFDTQAKTVQQATALLQELLASPISDSGKASASTKGASSMKGIAAGKGAS